MDGSGEYLLSYPFDLILFDPLVEVNLQDEYFLPANGFDKLSPIGDKFLYVSYRKKKYSDLTGKADLWIVDFSEFLKKFRSGDWPVIWLRQENNLLMWQGTDSIGVSLAEKYPDQKDWVLSYFDFKLKDSTTVNGRLYSKTDNKLYIKNVDNIVMIIPL